MAKDEKTVKVVHKGPFVGFYFMTYIGTLVYFIDRADGFWEVIIAFLQAAVWPALLINRIFTILQIQ